MLSLTRQVGEAIRIGDDIEIHVIAVRGNTVRLGIRAPRDITVHREEVHQRIAEANALAAQVTADVASALAAFGLPAPRPQTPETGPVKPPAQSPAPTPAPNPANVMPPSPPPTPPKRPIPKPGAPARPAPTPPPTEGHRRADPVRRQHPSPHRRP